MPRGMGDGAEAGSLRAYLSPDARVRAPLTSAEFHNSKLRARPCANGTYIPLRKYEIATASISSPGADDVYRHPNRNAKYTSAPTRPNSITILKRAISAAAK